MRQIRLLLIFLSIASVGMLPALQADNFMHDTVVPSARWGGLGGASAAGLGWVHANYQLHKLAAQKKQLLATADEGGVGAQILHDYYLKRVNQDIINARKQRQVTQWLMLLFGGTSVAGWFANNGDDKDQPDTSNNQSPPQGNSALVSGSGTGGTAITPPPPPHTGGTGGRPIIPKPKPIPPVDDRPDVAKRASCYGGNAGKKLARKPESVVSLKEVAQQWALFVDESKTQLESLRTKFGVDSVEELPNQDDRNAYTHDLNKASPTTKMYDYLFGKKVRVQDGEFFGQRGDGHCFFRCVDELTGRLDPDAEAEYGRRNDAEEPLTRDLIEQYRSKFETDFKKTPPGGNRWAETEDIKALTEHAAPGLGVITLAPVGWHGDSVYYEFNGLHLRENWDRGGPLNKTPMFLANIPGLHFDALRPMGL